MWKPSVGVFVGCLLIYHANGRPLAEVDCVVAPYTAWSLVRHGSLDVRPYAAMNQYLGTQVWELADGRRVSIRPPGSALAAVPVVAPFAVGRDEPLRDRNMQHLGKLAAAGCVALAVVLFHAVCRRRVPSATTPATVLFALGTGLWSTASQALWMHGPAVFWLMLALWLLSRAADGVGRCPHLLAGAALGMAVVCRPTAAFFAPATAVALVAGGRWRAAGWLTLGGVGPVAGLCVLNWTLFGDPALGGYAGDNWAERPPLCLGLGGLLVAPSRGVFVYSPALLVAIPGLVRLCGRSSPAWGGFRAVLVGWAAAAAATVVFYARWYEWRGGWCFGPRFLIEAMPIACLLFAVGYADLGRWGRRMAWGLIAVSVLVQAVGVFGGREYVPWHERHERQDQGRCLFELHDTQIEAHARATWADLQARIGVDR